MGSASFSASPGKRHDRTAQFAHICRRIGAKPAPWIGDPPRPATRAAGPAVTAAPVVDVDALWVRFGAVDAVRGIDLRVRARRGHRAARPQRRRQVHHDAGAGRRDPADRGPGAGRRPRRPHRDARGQAGHRLLPRRRRPGPAGDAVGAPPARRPAAPAARRLGGPRPRPARALRPRRRRAPGHRRLQPRHGPTDVGRPRGLPRARGAAARRAVRRRRPARRRGDHGGHRRRPRPRRRRAGLHPPARARRRRPASTRSCCAAGPRSPSCPPPRWAGRPGAGVYRALLD